MTIIRNDILKSTSAVFERADRIEDQLNVFLNKFHGNAVAMNSQFVDYRMIGDTDWTDYTDCPDAEVAQVRALFREIFELRKLGSKMVSKFAAERTVTDLTIKMIKSWKFHFDQLKEKLMHYNYSVIAF